MLTSATNKYYLNPISYICLVSLFLGLFSISKQSLWLDEYTSIQVAEKDLDKIITGKAFDNHTPPFYYMLMHFWLKLGNSEFVLRSFSVIFAVLSIYLIYFLGKMIFSYRIALFSASLTAISPFHVYYSQEGRMYTLLMVLTVAAIIYFIRIIESGRFKDYLLFFLLSVIGIYTHYYYAFLLLSLNIVYFYRFFKKRDELTLKYWFILQILISVSLLPWMSVILNIAQSGGQQRTFLFSVIPYTFFRFNAGYSMFPLNIGVKEKFLNAILEHIWELSWFYIFFGVLFIYGLIKIVKEGKNKDIIIAWLFLPAFISLMLSYKINMLSERYLSISFPPYILLLAFAILSIRKTIVRNIIICLCTITFLVGLSYYYFSQNFGKEQWRDVASHISIHGEQQELIITEAAFVAPLFSYYYDKSGNASNIVGIKSLEQLEVLLETQSSKTIWLIQSHSSLNDRITNALEQRFFLTGKEIFPYETGIKVYRFSSLDRKNNGR